MIAILAGVVIGAFIFAALLWSIYRAVTTRGFPRANAVLLSLATIVGMAGLTYNAPLALMIAAPACLLFGLAQMFTDPGWRKLFPLVQFGLGYALFQVLLFSAA